MGSITSFRIAVLVLFNVLSLAAGEKITLGMRVVPPYVEQRSDGSITGLEYDIITAALKASGYDPVVNCFPLARLHESFRAGVVQAAAPARADHKLSGILTDVYLVYSNAAFVLKQSGRRLNAVGDLKGLRVLAFQTAHSILGSSYAAIAENNPRYAETTKQSTQTHMLFARRVDVVVCDERIFYYYLRSTDLPPHARDSVAMFRLFPSTEYRVVFATKAHADAFNKGLRTIRSNGTYARILEKYSIND